MDIEPIIDRGSAGVQLDSELPRRDEMLGLQLFLIIVEATNARIVDVTRESKSVQSRHCCFFSLAKQD